MTEPAAYCYTEPAEDDADGRLFPSAEAVAATAAQGGFADCVLCGEPTEHPASQPGSVLCPVCTWQQAQRLSCSG